MANSQISLKILDWRDCPIHRAMDRNIYAIGDVHGRADLLAAIHELIASEAKPGSLVIHLGDLVDRGPHSIQVMALAGRPIRPDIETRNLIGNHEQMLMIVLEHAAPEDLAYMTKLWCRNGGDMVLAEIGLGANCEMEYAENIRDSLASALVPHMQTLRSQELFVRVENLLFVHAGINPQIPLAAIWNQTDLSELPYSYTEQSASPLWVREPFLNYQGRFADGVFVIHGHTIAPEVQFKKNRLGLDTGAYRTGILSCAHFSEGRVRVIQAVGEPMEF